MEPEEHVDLLIEGEDGETFRLSFSANSFCIQWSEATPDVVGKMAAMLSVTCDAYRELTVGKIFGVPLLLVEREGVFSFKAMAPDGDLLRVDLSDTVASKLAVALTDV
jgi:hypothetical protein